MPSNPTLPEDVHDQWVQVLCAVHEEAGEGPLPSPNAMVEALAPLIIGWARKDQAEKDAQICQRIQDDPEFPESGSGVVAAKIVIRAQFTTETTGGE